MAHPWQWTGFAGATEEFKVETDKDVTIVMWSNAANSNVSRTTVPAIAGAITGSGQ
jgi:hypothetical protein